VDSDLYRLYGPLKLRAVLYVIFPILDQTFCASVGELAKYLGHSSPRLVNGLIYMACRKDMSVSIVHSLPTPLTVH